VPYLLVTGYQGDQLGHPLLCAVPRLAKSWNEQDLAGVLRQLWWQRRVASGPTPSGNEGRPEGQAERHWHMAEAQRRAVQQVQALVAATGAATPASARR
jgi:hypothetical protein